MDRPIYENGGGESTNENEVDTWRRADIGRQRWYGRTTWQRIWERRRWNVENNNL